MNGVHNDYQKINIKVVGLKHTIEKHTKKC